MNSMRYRVALPCVCWLMVPNAQHAHGQLVNLAADKPVTVDARAAHYQGHECHTVHVICTAR